MNQKTEERSGAEVQGIDVIDFGDAMVETKQPGAFPVIADTCCTYTYFGE